MVREIGLHFARVKKGVERWKSYYRNKGYGSKVEVASKQIHSIDGTKYVIKRGKRLKRK